MNAPTSSRPTMPARIDRFTESRPSVGSTRADWTTSSGTGSAPEFNSSDRSRALAVVKRPSITPEPEVNTSLIVGDEMTLLSSEIWTAWPWYVLDRSIQRWASGPWNSKCTHGGVLQLLVT